MNIDVSSLSPQVLDSMPRISGAKIPADLRNISFKSVTIVNAQTGDRDALAFVVDGDTTDLGVGGINDSPETVDLEAVTGTSPISSFALGTGNSPSQSINKWSVEGIGIKYDMGVFFCSCCLSAYLCV